MNTENSKIPRELNERVGHLIGVLKKSMKLISDHHAKKAIGTELVNFIEAYRKLGGEL